MEDFDEFHANSYLLGPGLLAQSASIKQQVPGNSSADGWHTKRQRILPAQHPMAIKTSAPAHTLAAASPAHLPAAPAHPTGSTEQPEPIASTWQQRHQPHQHQEQQQQQQPYTHQPTSAAMAAVGVPWCQHGPAAASSASQAWAGAAAGTPLQLPPAASYGHSSQLCVGNCGAQHWQQLPDQQRQQQQQDDWWCDDDAEEQDSQQQQHQQHEEEGEEGVLDGEDDQEKEDEEEEEGAQQQPEEEEEEEEGVVQLQSADFDLSRDEVISRIEQLACDLVAAAAGGQLPTLSCISTAATNVHMAPRDSLATGANDNSMGMQGFGACSATQGFGVLGGSGGAVEPDEEEDAAAENEPSTSEQQQQQGQQHVLRLGSKVQTKTLLGNNGAQANSIVRALQLLDSVHALLRAGRTSTQRDIYYTLVGRPGFERPRDVTSAIQSVLGMLRVRRAALGISAASKGAVAGGRLYAAAPRPSEPWVDCRSVGPSGRPIPGEVGAVDAMALRSAGARCILVVEKDAVFQSLVESRLHEQLPCILITGRGMPDVASRAFLAAVVEASRHWAPTGNNSSSSSSSASLSSRAFSWQQQQQQQPSLPVLGVVDWNPGGVSILLAYKYGAAALGLESARYAVPSLCWLGVTSDMLQDAAVPESRCHPLSSRDKTLLVNLKARLAPCPDWVQELEEMEGSGLKADIEALKHEELVAELQRRVLQGNYLR